MQVLASNNYIAFKQAIKIALGGKGSFRPKFKERKLYGFVFQDDLEETEYVFEDLNYKYTSELPLSDVTIFNTEEYGKFFYEYGRAILGNLMICLTKADWNSVSQSSNDEAPYVANYLSSLITLNDKVETVVENFKKEYIDNSVYSNYKLVFTSAAKMLMDYKDKVASFRDSPDMCNTDIFLCAYYGLLYTLYGLFLLLPGIGNNSDIASFMRSPSSRSFLGIYKSILKDSLPDEETKRHFISLVYAFYKMTKFYKLTSGFEELDSFVGTMYDIAENLVSKFDETSEEETAPIRTLIDPEFTEEGAYGSGITLQSFTSVVDPVLEIIQFRNGNIIPRDNSDIWCFGETYLKCYYPFANEGTDEEENITSKLNPIMKDYLKEGMKGAYTNEEVQRAFGAVKNIVTGIDLADFTFINPGLILQLTIMAGAFRVLENRTTERSTTAKNEINGAIDIIDTLIYKLYEMWFKSGKYFKQPTRPMYAKSDACNETLKYLRSEVDNILTNYLEFVAYGISLDDSNKLSFKSLKDNRFAMYNKEHLCEFVGKSYPNADVDTFVRLCAKREGRSLVQCAFENNTPFEFVNIITSYGNKELSKYYIANYADNPENHTGVSIIDRAIDNSKEARSSSLSNPEVYAIAVIGIIWVYFEDLFKNKDVGNYFDFGNASSSLSSYNIEHIITNALLIPLKSKYNLSKI